MATTRGNTSRGDVAIGEDRDMSTPPPELGIQDLVTINHVHRAERLSHDQ
jgi:hypothetical protein